MKAIAAPAFVISLFAGIALLAAAFPAHAQFDTPLIDTRSSGSATNLNQEMIQNVSAGRDPWSVLTTAPGVQTGPAGQISTPGLTGTSGDALFTIDGVVVGENAALGNGSAFKEFEFIEEIQVQTGYGSAEYGRQAASGVINVVTKNGTNEWQGTGEFLGFDNLGIRSVVDPRILIEIMEKQAGGYCLNGMQVQSGGNPVTGGSSGPIQFGFDSPITIGVGPGSGTFGAGATGSLNLAQIPGCDGQPNGLSFVDAPGPVTTPNPTHLMFGENGVFAVDMGRVGMNYGFGDARGSNPNMLDDTHAFNSSFYVNGRFEYREGGFQLQPQAAGQVAAQGPDAAGDGRQGLFLYGVDAKGLGSDWAPRVGATWDPYAIRLGDAPTSLPDANGDGKPDTYFLSLATLTPGSQGVMGGAFKPGTGSGGGGALQVDTDARPNYDYLQDTPRLNEYLTLNLGLRYDQQEPPEERYVSPFADETSSGSKPRIGGAFDGTSYGDLGGPIIRDKLWIWGSYDLPEVNVAEEDPPLFSRSFYESAPDYRQLFPHGFYSRDEVSSAPGGRGVQEIGIEIQSTRAATPTENGHAPSAPGGAAPEDVGPGGLPRDWLEELADALDSPLIYVVAEGGPTGEVFQVQIVHPASGPVAIDGLVALEPVAATAVDREDFERELARAGGEKEILKAAGYCLNQDLRPPPAGTVYRVADAARQAVFEPMRKALDAARRLRDAGLLNPDSDPEGYYHSIRQWAVWSVEKGYDREGFLEAFVERTEKNFRDAGQPWSTEVAAAVRGYGEGRWSDIREILDAAAESSP